MHAVIISTTIQISRGSELSPCPERTPSRRPKFVEVGGRVGISLTKEAQGFRTALSGVEVAFEGIGETFAKNFPIGHVPVCSI